MVNWLGLLISIVFSIDLKVFIIMATLIVDYIMRAELIYQIVIVFIAVIVIIAVLFIPG